MQLISDKAGLRLQSPHFKPIDCTAPNPGPRAVVLLTKRFNTEEFTLYVMGVVGNRVVTNSFVRVKIAG